MRALPLLLLTLLMAACGQTGDLYLPQEIPEASQPTEAQKKKGQVPSPADPAPAAPEAR
jgi:predicted small lipoprotein YifL